MTRHNPSGIALGSLVAVMGIGALAAMVRPAHGAATIVVNTTTDEDAANATCSLREAIIAANTNANYNGCAASGAGVNDTIVFNLGPGTPTITVGATALPVITQWVTIDGSAGRVELRGPGGPLVSGRHGLTVGTTGFGTIVRNLVINNFADDGIFINADEVYVYGCFIGTDATGMTAVPNQGFGVQIFGGNGNRIGGATSGGPCTGDCNVISGATNFKANVLLDLNSINTLVRGNFIGTNVTGTGAITPNDVQGIVDKGSGNRIGGAGGTTPGGACTGDCNLISGNNINGGVVIDQAATGALVQGNFIGTDVTGNDSISNGRSEGFSVGILSYATGATIGGTMAEARNVVSGNRGTGIQIRGVSTVVLGNYIGTNSAGTAAVANSGPGVTVYQASGAIIGGTAAGAGNLISGASNNGDYGIQILQSTNTQIIGNRIGTAADGMTPLPNMSEGVLIRDQSSNSIVGGQVAGAGNTIAFNGGNGVRVDAGIPQVRSNTIRGNSIYSNDAAGIALSSNGNDSLAPPTIADNGPLHGTACAPCAVEIFSDSEDEGRVFEGSVFTNDGAWTFTEPVSGPHVTATNTDMSNNTSPFSAPFSLPTATATSSSTPTATDPPTASHTVTRTGTPTRTLPIPTATASQNSTATGAPTASRTVTRTSTATQLATSTPSPNGTHTATATRTSTPTGTAPVTATGVATSPATASATAMVSPTPAGGATATPTELPTSPSGAPTATPTPTAPASPCTGDCDGDDSVSISELITGVNIALGTLPPSACPAFQNEQGTVDVTQLIRSVGNALRGCPPPPAAATM